MKRAIITLSVAAMISALLLPNYILAGGIMAKGVKFGYNFANISSTDDEIEYNLKTGFAVGGFLILGIRENLDIRPEVLYSTKGTIAKFDFWGTAYKVTGSLNYIEIPILLQYLLPIKGSFKPYVFMGPALGIKLSAKVKLEVEGEEEEIEDIEEDIKSKDFGLVFGAGAVLVDKISFEIRYNIGLSPIYYTSPSDSRNRVISIMLGFII